MYNKKYHNIDLSQNTFLITGGAGFIGSNLVEYLLKYNAKHVRVLDDLSNGYFDNIKKFIPLSNFEFLNGDIRNFEICKKAVNNIDYVSHQAALGSVPRSIENPVLSNDVNVGGFLNMLYAAKENGNIKNFVYAASSSTYGDSKDLPKIEGNEGRPLSPYAVTKFVNELYAEVFSSIYNFNTIGLRYFNVFGPNQNPNNPYAAVIPIFCKKFINKEQPIINGDGTISRDFTFVENVVQANIKALESSFNKHQVFNVACGESHSLNDIIAILNSFEGTNIQPIYQKERIGDVKHSLASIHKIINLLNYTPEIKFTKGLEITYNWYIKNHFL